MNTSKSILITFLIVGLLAFCGTLALEVVYPASLLAEDSENHKHSDSSTFCSSVVSVHSHDCIHSSTTIDLTDNSFFQINTRSNDLQTHIYTFDICTEFELYQLRAPPSPSRTSI